MSARTITLSLLVLLAASGAAVAADAVGGKVDESVRPQVASLLKDLDNETYEVRQLAAKRFEELLAKPELGPLLAAELQQVLLRPDASLEVRWHATRWTRRLPKVPPEPAGDATPAEIDRLIGQLDADGYAARVGAARRLEHLVGNPKLVYPVLRRLKERLANPDLPADSLQRLEAAWQAARRAWLLGDVRDEQWPAVSAEQLARWIDDLSRSDPADKPGATQAAARIADRELRDLLARDREVPRVVRALEQRLRGDVDRMPVARLRELLELAQPALVAEYWSGRRHAGEQHLLVGVPSQAEGAARPSHFDRIDDRTAHCVSGQSLTPGDYPVQVAFPHPSDQNAFFHLINLPTPRQRMAYTYQAKIDDSVRLAAISRRTFDRLLAERRPLDESELTMLAQLDPAELSRFAGKYFNAVEDTRLVMADEQRPALQVSRHGWVCARLAIDGTKDAVPGLLEAIDKGRFLAPTPMTPYRMADLAALSIARRYPWSEVDVWLAGRVARSELLVSTRGVNQAPAWPAVSPEVGATAAAILLGRHRQPLAPFGLQAAGDPLLVQFGVDGYRFLSPDGRKQVAEWWQHEIEKRRRP
jgi:hypothetical protein